ncbi:hypothetical protein [Paraferrimonas haliotis]|uniref:Uncharacterized protein n=1 Tax=Paraferrimonas haliotis TaxID=2013866 RepID=A0AA37TIQ4_9GAMM|nr:hypothetical protein [Paraferrimonas haliotis]GLS82102.1 hypothetical protein GCM10007894_00790 [Paraferrimonas haliotis]
MPNAHANVQPCCVACGTDAATSKCIAAAPGGVSFVERSQRAVDGELPNHAIIFDHYINNQADLLNAIPLMTKQLQAGASIQINRTFDNTIALVKYAKAPLTDLGKALQSWLCQAQSQRPWVCARCAGYVCRYCGDLLNYTPGADSLSSDGRLWHTPIFPIAPQCNPNGCPQRPSDAEADIHMEEKDGILHFTLKP